MPGALVGVASCARCGGMQNPPGLLCQSCGTVLTPAARDADASLLTGVARSSGVRGYLAALIDVVLLVIAAAVAGVQVASGAFGMAIWICLLCGVFVAGQLLLFLRRRRTLGGAPVRLRTVDNPTGEFRGAPKQHQPS
jgi:hypothetical protein